MKTWAWNVATKQKKSAFEHELWRKGDMVIRRVVGYRWGSIILETESDQPPVLVQTDGPSADGVDVYNTGHTYEFDSLDDSWYEDIIWPDDMPEEERDRLLQVWEDDFFRGWEEEGWEQYELELWFHGPLEITEYE